MVRPIAQWIEILGEIKTRYGTLDASIPMAKRIMGDLYYYTIRANADTGRLDEDRQELANALRAFHKLNS
jgi:hypothetical protein